MSVLFMYFIFLMILKNTDYVIYRYVYRGMKADCMTWRCFNINDGNSKNVKLIISLNRRMKIYAWDTQEIEGDRSKVILVPSSPLELTTLTALSVTTTVPNISYRFETSTVPDISYQSEISTVSTTSPTTLTLAMAATSPSVANLTSTGNTSVNLATSVLSPSVSEGSEVVI